MSFITFAVETLSKCCWLNRYMKKSSIICLVSYFDRSFMWLKNKIRLIYFIKDQCIDT